MACDLIRLHIPALYVRTCLRCEKRGPTKARLTHKIKDGGRQQRAALKSQQDAGEGSLHAIRPTIEERSVEGGSTFLFRNRIQRTPRGVRRNRKLHREESWKQR